MELTSLFFAAFALSTATAELIELSYTYNVDAPTSPKLTQFTHKIVKKGLNKFGIWVELNEFCASEHSGTHVDAPVHFAEKGWALEAIPTKRLWRVPAVVIDVSNQIKLSKNVLNYEIKVKDLEDWEAVNGIIPDATLVLIRTGWGAKVNNLREYSGLDQHNKNNFPGLGKGAAEWLANHGNKHGHETGVIGVGIDTISVDVGQSVRYPSHVALYTKNIYGIENMANLDKLPVKGAIVTVLPMRIGGGSGAPARIIAEVGEEHQLTSASPKSNQSLAVMLVAQMITALALVMAAFLVLSRRRTLRTT
ncbi:isatin hydrolase-like [Palaemon carinicauda]|uniref:isatin hydrolase-like n=1 Tax=Palaemon carinicauda TaxID=392227 RepID=UPI0035B64F50